MCDDIAYLLVKFFEVLLFCLYKFWSLDCNAFFIQLCNNDLNSSLLSNLEITFMISSQ